MNPSQAPRFFSIADWTLENATVDGDVTTAVHVDKLKNECFTMTSGWDGFDELRNHKAYQTMTLPAGAYTFIADYAVKNNAGKCGDSYLVAAKGKGLPDTENVHQALGVKRMQPKTKMNMYNKVQFILEEETEVSLGFVINMSGDLCATISEFHLYRNEVEFLEVKKKSEYEMTIGTEGSATLCLPYGAALPEGIKAFTVTAVDKGIAYVAPLEGNVIPAETGLIVKGGPGTYRFVPSHTEIVVKSLLKGVLKDMPTTEAQRYYHLKGENFVVYTEKMLEANRAYLVTAANNTQTNYQIEELPTGIENIEIHSSDAKIYDISGRHVSTPLKGIYIYDGKKKYK